MDGWMDACTKPAAARINARMQRDTETRLNAYIETHAHAPMPCHFEALQLTAAGSESSPVFLKASYLRLHWLFTLLQATVAGLGFESP